MPHILLLIALLAWSGCSPGVDGTSRFTTTRVDVRTERVELFLREERGQPFNSFDHLRDWLAGRHQRLRFAMNGGMFTPGFSPVGLLVQDGRQISPLNLADGVGNFFLKPNGVFLISGSGPHIVESGEYPPLAGDVRVATQSGPLLVRKGQFHPAINAASTSRLIRNGVGISGDTVMFVISEEPVTFYQLATYFRDTLHCPDALYLDGVVSGIYSAEGDRSDNRADLGPIIGVVQ